MSSRSGRREEQSSDCQLIPTNSSNPPWESLRASPVNTQSETNTTYGQLVNCEGQPAGWQASGVLPSAQESMLRILNSVQRFENAVPKIEKAFEEIARHYVLR